MTLLVVSGLYDQQCGTLTALPARTHRRHGRAESHPRCFFLQLTHAEATCAFVRRVDLGPNERTVVTGVEASTVGTEYGGGTGGGGTSLTAGNCCDGPAPVSSTVVAATGSDAGWALGFSPDVCEGSSSGGDPDID